MSLLHTVEPPKSAWTEPDLAALTQTRSMGRILKDAVLLCNHHGWSFTRILIKPTLLIALTPMIAIWLSFQAIFIARDLFMEILAASHIDCGTPQMACMLTAILMLVVSIVSCLVTMLPFFRGFWELFVNMVSMNRNTLEVLENRSPDFKEAFLQVPAAHYTNLLVVMMILWFIPFVLSIPAVGLLGLTQMMGQGALIGALICGGLVLVSSLPLIYVSLVFQVQAFEKTAPNPFPTLMRSIRLLWGWENFWRATVLLLLWGSLANFIAPVVVIRLLEFLQIKPLLALLFEPVATDICQYSLSYAAGIIQTVVGKTPVELIPVLAAEMVNYVVACAVLIFLIPFGTFCFTLLYLDLKARQIEKV